MKPCLVAVDHIVNVAWTPFVDIDEASIESSGHTGLLQRRLRDSVVPGDEHEPDDVSSGRGDLWRVKDERAA